MAPNTSCLNNSSVLMHLNDLKSKSEPGFDCAADVDCWRVQPRPDAEDTRPL